MATPKVAVVYYSATGTVHSLAQEYAAGAAISDETKASARYAGSRVAKVAAQLIRGRR